MPIFVCQRSWPLSRDELDALGSSLLIPLYAVPPHECLEPAGHVEAGEPHRCHCGAEHLEDRR